MKKFAYGLLAQGKNVSYVTLVLVPLSAMFHHAIEDGHLAVSPTPRILRHAHTDPHRKNDFFTEEETAASLLIQQGESLAYVKEQMGHHSIKITVDTYDHLMPGGNKAAVDKLDRLEKAIIRNPDATANENPVFRQTGSL